MQTVTEIADIQKPVMNAVQISTNLADKEIYVQEKAKDAYKDKKTGEYHQAKPARYALTKKGLTKLMRAAGIKILSSQPVIPSTCQKCASMNAGIGKPVRCGGCPNKDVKYECRISVPQLTGQELEYVAHREIVVDDVLATMNSEGQKAEFLKFRNEMCESKAINRALRAAMQIKPTYLIEEFNKPFVVAYLVPNLDNPDVKAEAVKHFFNAADNVYGRSQKTRNTVYVDDDHEDGGYEAHNEPIGQPYPQGSPSNSAVQNPNNKPLPWDVPPGDGVFCADCGNEIFETEGRNNKIWSPEAIQGYSIKRYGRCLCTNCQKMQGRN